MPRLAGRAGSVRGGWHYVSMTAVSLGQLWHHLTAWAARQGRPPSHLLILGTGLLAGAVVTSRRAWPVARTAATSTSPTTCGGTSIGIAGRAPHPARPDQPLAGGPQMVEVSRDGKRVYFTNSLYGAWDDQFYPDGVGAWMAKIDADGFTLDERFFPNGDDFRGLRVHQVRLQGGDASSDSYCYR